MAINLEQKSNRILGGRRFTSTDLSTSQEAFQSNLDINASEIYTQAELIPETGLPFSGSSQNGDIYQSDGKNILKYYYRQRLTKSNVDRDVWFFMAPTGSAAGVTPQLIQSGQQTNFISPKYGATSIANSTAEDATPGYNIRVFVSTTLDSGSLGGSDVQAASTYQFDYKTGVLQFDSDVPSSSEIVYVTAYQYVGKTLANDPNIGIFTQTGSYYNTTNDLKITGSLALLGNLVVDGNTTFRSPDTGSYSVTVEGQMRVLQREINSAVRKAKIEVQNLGSIGDQDDDNVLDLGGFF